jgi:hypothetical protein
MTAEPKGRPPGSLASAMNWMGGLSLLLFWLPVIGPGVAGFIGGVKAGTIKRAMLAVFVPGVLTGVLAAAGVGYLTRELFWGVLAGIGGIAFSFLQIGPMFVGAILGGLTAELRRSGS